MPKAGASSFGKIFSKDGDYHVVQYMNNRKHKMYRLSFKTVRRY